MCLLLGLALGEIGLLSQIKRKVITSFFVKDQEVEEEVNLLEEAYSIEVNPTRAFIIGDLVEDPLLLVPEDLPGTDLIPVIDPTTTTTTTTTRTSVRSNLRGQNLPFKNRSNRGVKNRIRKLKAFWKS